VHEYSQCAWLGLIKKCNQFLATCKTCIKQNSTRQKRCKATAYELNIRSHDKFLPVKLHEWPFVAGNTSLCLSGSPLQWYSTYDAAAGGNISEVT
jgi:hypothetical protein